MNLYKYSAADNVRAPRRYRMNSVRCRCGTTGRIVTTDKDDRHALKFSEYVGAPSAAIECEHVPCPNCGARFLIEIGSTVECLTWHRRRSAR